MRETLFKKRVRTDIPAIKLYSHIATKAADEQQKTNDSSNDHHPSGSQARRLIRVVVFTAFGLLLFKLATPKYGTRLPQNYFNNIKFTRGSMTVSEVQKIALMINLCTTVRNENELSSIVWSHRAHLPDNINDGSELVTTQLLLAGISNFDIDVSPIAKGRVSIDSVVSSTVDTNPNDLEFLVAHPSQLVMTDDAMNITTQKSNFQTIQQFLSLIANHFPVEQRTRHRPFVTIEPKFSPDDLGRLSRLAFLVASSAIAANTAIIVSSDTMFQNVNQAIQRFVSSSGSIEAVGNETAPTLAIPGIALAYRSVSSSGAGQAQAEALFRWKDRFNHVERYHALLHNTTKTAQTALILMPHLGLQVQDQQEQLALTPSQADQSIMRLYQLQHMFRTVSWIIDTENQLFQALAFPETKAVISNNPVLLLESLKNRYRLDCQGGMHRKKDNGPPLG